MTLDLETLPLRHPSTIDSQHLALPRSSVSTLPRLPTLHALAMATKPSPALARSHPKASSSLRLTPNATFAARASQILHAPHLLIWESARLNESIPQTRLRQLKILCGGDPDCARDLYTDAKCGERPRVLMPATEPRSSSRLSGGSSSSATPGGTRKSRKKKTRSGALR